MSDREELQALRRLAELEAKAAGSLVEEPTRDTSFLGQLGQAEKDFAAGLVKGASNIGATLLAPVDAAARALGVENDYIGRTDRRSASTEALQGMGADPTSASFTAGELASEVAGTAGVGGTLAGAVRAVPWLARVAPRLAAALESGGFRIGAAGGSTLGNIATRAGAGAAVGGVSAGLVNPSEAPAGAAIGGVAPYAVQAAGKVGAALRPKVSEAVASLAQRARELGIDIPADRLINSRPINAAAASLNYVPLSGRAGTEARMMSQFNRGVSRTVGQDSDNVMMALRKADQVLGGQFDDFLKSNKVVVDDQFLSDLLEHAARAKNELGADGMKVIGNQIDGILEKAGTSGAIDGQAAYNIKKTLDRIGRRNSSEAYYALDLKRSLMDALNRSVGPQQAEAFAKLRGQYGNMLALDKVVKQHGAEGGVSVAKLANSRAHLTPELNELADIAGQFLITREAPHGAAQRVVMGVLAPIVGGYTGTLPVVGGVMAGGRAANMALNSNMVRGLALGETPQAFRTLEDPIARALMYRGATATSQ